MVRRDTKANALHLGATGVLVLLVAAACGPAAGLAETAAIEARPAAGVTAEPTGAVLQPRDTVPSVDEVLAGDIERRFEKRTSASRSAKLRWDPSEESFAPDCGAELSTEHMVVHGDERGVRVVLRAGWANLVGHLDRSELRTSVIATTRLEQEGVSAPDGVMLRPGAEVFVLEKRDGRSKVRVVDFCMRIVGWLPNDVVGHEYRPDDMESNLAQTTRQLAPGSTITAAGGGAIATASGCTGAPRVQLEGPPKKSQQRVVMQSRRMSITGSLPVAKLKKIEDTYGMIALLPNEGDTVPEGTPLFASPNGRQVGVAKTTQRMKRQRSQEGRSEIFVHLAPFCSVPVWVEDAAFAKD